MDAIKEKANALGLDFHTLAEAYSANFRALVEGGVTDLQQQITLVSTIIQAEAAKNITGMQALKDSIDLLGGRASQLVFAREIGLTSEAIKEATAQGNLFGAVMGKLTGYQEAAKATAASFSGQLQVLRNQFEAAAGDLAKPVFDALKDGLATLRTDLASGSVTKGLQQIGDEAGTLVRIGVGVTHWAIENAGALIGVAHAAGEMALAIGAVKLVGFIGELGAAAVAAKGLSISLASVNQWVAIAAAAVGGFNLGTYISTWELGGRTVTEWGELTVITVESTLSRIKGWMLNLAQEVKAGVLSTLNEGLNQVRLFAIGAADILNSVTGGRVAIDTSGLMKAIDATDAATVQLQADKAKSQKSINDGVKAELEDYRQQIALVKQDTDNRHAAATAQAHVTSAVKDATFAKVQGVEADEKGASAAHKAADAAREQAMLQREIEQDKLKNIEGAGARIKSGPFLFDESKARLMQQVYQQQAAQIQHIISLDLQRAAAEKGSTNPGMAAQYRANTKEISAMGIALAKVRQEQRQLSLSGTMQKSLTAWVNSFGTTAQAAATIITNTLGHAVDGLSNAISGLVLGTMTWKQAFQQAASAIVQDIIRIVIQQTVGRAVMYAVNMAFGSEEASASAALAESTASAWSEAAILASIATYGSAAYDGLTSVLTVVGAGQGALAGMQAGSSGGGGFAAGGYTGNGSASEAAGIVHRREYVFDAQTVDRGGGPAAFDRMRAHINSPRGDYMQSRVNTRSLAAATSGVGPRGDGGGRHGGGAYVNKPQKVENHFALVQSESEANKYLSSARGQRHLVKLTHKNRQKMGIRT